MKQLFQLLGSAALVAVSFSAVSADERVFTVHSKAEDPTERAKHLYERGARFYNLNQFDSALVSFTSAYMERTEPAFLFNIAQCERQLKQWDHAGKSYRAFLRETPSVTPAQREEVQKLIASMEQAAREEEARAKLPPTGTKDPTARAPAAQTDAATTALVAPAPPSARARTRPWVVGVSIAAGVVAVGAAVGLGVGLTRGSSSSPSAGSSGGTYQPGF